MKIFLLIIVFHWGAVTEYRTPMPDMKTCQETIKTSKTALSQGAENEAGITMMCVPSGQWEREYSNEWHNVKRK